MKSKRLAALVLGVTLLIAVSFSFSSSQITSQTVQIGNEDFSFQVADDVDERTQGLSGRQNLPEDEVLIFVFSRSDIHGFWMKDMNFSIDIIWLDEEKKVVDFETDVSPDTYPESFEPKSPAKYVIETNVGMLASTELQIGDEIEFTLP